MKIACISTSQVPSTTANSIQVMKVCQAMQEMGHEIRLWIPGNEPIRFDEIAGLYGLRTVFQIQPTAASARLKRYDFAWKSVRKADHWGTDCIYTWAPQVAVLAARRGKTVILEMHDRATGQVGPILLRQYLSEKNPRTGLVCVTSALRHALEEQLRLPLNPAKVVIAPNGVDLERYQNLPNPIEARRKLGLPQVPTAAYTGHFYAGRGVEVLFGLAAAYPQVHFLWIGGRESELAAVRERLQAIQLANVTLTGFVENSRLPLYQAAAELLLMPYERAIAGSSGGNSADICSPMKMFEYMATGRLILSSDLPVIREVLDDDTAFFCPPEDTAGWVRTFGEALHDLDGMTKKGILARERIAQYTIQARQKKILGAFLP